MNPEDVYAEEAQEDIIEGELRPANERDASKSINQITVLEGDAGDEDRPLLSRPQTQRHRGYSYERAINEPWTGSYRDGNRSWYKSPSVSRR